MYISPQVSLIEDLVGMKDGNIQSRILHSQICSNQGKKSPLKTY
jgi:hypothetical protein